MSFSINTNISSLEAQNYLANSSNFQSQTINEVTSGLRIVNSGDDAAGLAVANGLRSDQAVLNQGIQNGNNGLATLQTVDSGMNNISTLLDRARTLATESASGTFTGDRNTLNSEFQSVIQEITRQATSIGMNQGGQFAQNLSVFIGGGQGSTAAAATQNGTIGLNLAQSAVDAQSLGLQGVEAESNSKVDLSAASATSVQAITSNAANKASEAVSGFTNFNFSGSGFSGGNAIGVSVNLAGVTDTQTLVTAINSAIANAGNGATSAATAFKNANITASVVTNATTGGQQIAFSSSSSAFQVQAGDGMSNALMGNLNQSASATGTNTAATVDTSSATAATRQLSFNFDGSSSPITVQIAQGTATDSKADIVSQLNQDAAFNSKGTASLQGNQIVITSNNTGSTSAVQVTSTSALTSALGLTGASGAAPAAGTGASLTTTFAGSGSITNSTAASAETVKLQFQGAGLTSPQTVSVNIHQGDNAATILNSLTSAIASNTNLAPAGITIASNSSAGQALTFQSTTGQQFSVIAGGDTQNLLGLGTMQLGSDGSAPVQYSTTTGTAYSDTTSTGTATLQFSFNGAAANTTVGSGTGTSISVDLTAGDATSGMVTGGSTGITNGTVNTSTANQLYLTIDGTKATVDLTSGTGAHNGATESLSQVAQDITSQLSTLGTGGGPLGTATVNASGQLVITSASKGASSSVQIDSGANSAASALGLTNLAGMVPSVGTSRTGANLAAYLNTEFASSATLQGAGLTASFDNNNDNELTITSNNNTQFQLNSFTGGGSLSAATLTGTSQGTAADLTGTTISGNVAITAADQNFAISIDGTTYQTTLTAGSIGSIATQIQISLTAQGSTATVAANGSNQLVVTSGTTGSSSNITFPTNSNPNDAMSTLGFTASASNTGSNAAAADIQASGAPTSRTISTSDSVLTFNYHGSTYQATMTTGANASLADLEATLQTAINSAVDLSAGSGTLGSGKITVTDNGSGIALEDAAPVAGDSIQVVSGGPNDASTNLNLGTSAVTDTAASSGTLSGNQAGPVTITDSNNTFKFQIDGADHTVTLANGSSTMASIASQINTQVGANVASVNGSGYLTLTSTTTGTSSSVTLGQANNEFSSGLAGALGLSSPSINQGTTDYTVTNSKDQLNLTVDGTALSPITIGLGNYTNASQLAGAIQSALTTANITSVTATATNGQVVLTNALSGAGHTLAASGSFANFAGISGTMASGKDGNIGFGTQGVSFSGNTAGVAPSTSQDTLSGGAYQTGDLSFTSLANGSDNQTINISAIDSTGATQTVNVVLENNSQSQTGATIDSALTAINTALQQSNNSALQSVVAVKQNVGGAEKIVFESADTQFSVTAGTTADGSGINGQISSVNVQGNTQKAAISGAGSTADISTQTGAEAAVNALATAVQTLGTAQAAVGKGENLLNYAISLATSQTTNEAAAESDIRDANLAQEAANLSRAQILVQAGTAALAQANSAPQQLLSLLQH